MKPGQRDTAAAKQRHGGFIGALALALVVALVSPPPPAQNDPERQVEQIEEELRASQARDQRLQAEAEALAREIEDLRRRTVNAARLTQDTEDQLTELENRLIDLHDEETRLRRSLDGQQERMLAVLTGLQRLSLRPEESLLVQPAPLADTLRGAILLRAAVPELNNRVSTLRDELQRLHDVRAEIGRQHEAIGVTVNQLARQNNELEALLAQKTRLRSTTEAERVALAARTETLARDAADLRDLIARLEAERREAERLEAERLEAERREAEEIARVVAERAAARAAQQAAENEQRAAMQQAAVPSPPPPPAPPGRHTPPRYPPPPGRGHTPGGHAGTRPGPARPLPPRPSPPPRRPWKTAGGPCRFPPVAPSFATMGKRWNTARRGV